eukprot:139476_1
MRDRQEEEEEGHVAHRGRADQKGDGRRSLRDARRSAEGARRSTLPEVAHWSPMCVISNGRCYRSRGEVCSCRTRGGGGCGRMLGTGVPRQCASCGPNPLIRQAFLGGSAAGC